MEDIIVFGRGVYWQYKKNSIMKSFKVVAFIDSHAKNDEYLMQDNIRVYSPAYAVNCNLDIYVMVSNSYMNEMVHILQRLGVPNERIKTGLLIEPSFNEAEELLVENRSEINVMPQGIEINCSYGKFLFDDVESFRGIMRQLLSDKDTFAKELLNMPINPFSRQFGKGTGTAIDRYYIEKFLNEHRDVIHGDIMEIGSHAYTCQFGSNIQHAYALHINGWGEKDTIIGNLVTGEGIEAEFVDCFICTQTIQMIYSIHEVIKNIYGSLRPGGILLLTASGISQLSMNDYNNWGEYWRFTEQSMRKLMEEYFDPKRIQIETYGNVKTTMCFLYGIPKENLKQEDFEYNDVQYPLIVSAFCQK